MSGRRLRLWGRWRDRRGRRVRGGGALEGVGALGWGHPRGLFSVRGAC